MANKQN